MKKLGLPEAVNIISDFHRHHGYGLSAQLRPQLLLNAGEVAVEIDIQPAQAGDG